MTLGVIRISHEIVVDLENKDMVQHGKDALYEDLMNAVKYNELGSWIETEERKGLSKSDIPGFLLDAELLEEGV